VQISGLSILRMISSIPGIALTKTDIILGSEKEVMGVHMAVIEKQSVNST